MSQPDGPGVAGRPCRWGTTADRPSPIIQHHCACQSAAMKKSSQPGVAWFATLCAAVTCTAAASPRPPPPQATQRGA